MAIGKASANWNSNRHILPFSDWLDEFVDLVYILYAIYDTAIIPENIIVVNRPIPAQNIPYSIPRHFGRSIFCPVKHDPVNPISIPVILMRINVITTRFEIIIFV